jgi:hypothetical protein
MPARRWTPLAWIGFALVMVALFTTCLVLVAKDRFDWLVSGSYYLQSIIGLIFVGAIALIVAIALSPYRKTWRGIGVIVWALIALTSPLLGYLFLLPWALMLLTAPLVFAALYSWSRAARPAPAS